MNTTADKHPPEGYTLSWMLYKPGSGKYAYAGQAQVSGRHALWDRHELFREILASQTEVVTSAFANYDVVLRGPDDGPFYEQLLRQELHGHAWSQAAASLQSHPLQGLPIMPTPSQVGALREQLDLACTALEGIAQLDPVDAALDPGWARRVAKDAMTKLGEMGEPHVTVSDADGELTVTLHPSREAAMKRLLAFLGEYDEAWAQEAQDTLMATGACKVPVNSGHRHEVVKIIDQASLQLLRDAKLGRLAPVSPAAVVASDLDSDGLNAKVLLASNQTDAMNLALDLAAQARNSSGSTIARLQRVVPIVDAASRALMGEIVPPTPRMLRIPCEQEGGRDYLLVVAGAAAARSDADLLAEIQRIACELNAQDEGSPDGGCLDGRSVQENFEDRLHALGLRPVDVVQSSFCWDATSDELKPRRDRQRG